MDVGDGSIEVAKDQGCQQSHCYHVPVVDYVEGNPQATR